MMGLAPRLLFHPLPKGKEGLSSFMTRLAEGNGVKRGEVLNLHYGSEGFLSSLASLLGVSAEHPALTTVKLRMEMSARRNRRLWNLGTSRYCPICLDEQPIWLQHWEAKLVMACDLHKVKLVDTCGNCGEQLFWKRTQLSRCPCGAVIHAKSTAQASQEEIDAAAWITAKLYKEGQVPTHIDQLSVHQLHHLLSFLGVYDSLENNEEKPRSLNLEDLTTASRIGCAGLRVLSDWPNGFEAFLDRLVARNRSDDKAGRLNGFFGRFYNNFFDEFWEKPFEPYIEEFGRYLERNWRVSFTARNRELSEILRSRHPWVSACVLAKSLNTSREVLANLYEDDKISGHVVRTESGRKMFYVNRQDVPMIEILLQDQVDQATACKILGINKRRFAEIASHPLLGKPRKSAGRSGTWAVSRSRLKALIDVGGRSIPVLEDEAPNLISLGFALRHLYYRPDLNQLLSAVEEGTLRTAGLAENRTGIAAWMFDRVQFNAWIKGQNEYSFWSVSEAAKQLGVKEQVAYRLARNNMLESRISPTTGHLKIEPEALEKFKAKYVFSQEIAERMGGLLAKGIYKRLANIGIHPCSGPAVDGSPKCIYERTEALDLAIKALRKGRRNANSKTREALNG